MKRFFKRFGFDLVHGFSIIVSGAIIVVLFPDDMALIQDLIDSNSMSLVGFSVCMSGIGYLISVFGDAFSCLIGSRKEDPDND